jgi:lipoprotein LprG
VPIKTLTSDLTTSPSSAASGQEEITLGGSDVVADFVVLDGTLYMSLYMSLEPGVWSNFGAAPDLYDPTVILNPGTGVANLLANFSDPKVVGPETINSVQTIKITGQVSAEAVNKVRLADRRERRNRSGHRVDPRGR